MMYKAGTDQADPTGWGKPHNPGDGRECHQHERPGDEDQGFFCTWRKDDHPDQHVATNGDWILAVWPAEPKYWTRPGTYLIPLPVDPNDFTLQVGEL